MRGFSEPLTRSELKQKRTERKRRLASLILVPAIALGGLVAGVWGATIASANEFAPAVSVSTSNTYIAGEDLALDVTIGHGGGSDQYNLSVGVVMDAEIALVDAGTMGAPRIYESGALVRQNATTVAEECTVAGLTWDTAASACRVPAGAQYMVFQNISDLPAHASAAHSLTLRPNATVFDAGDTINLHMTAFTSADERFIPTFPGSTGVAVGSEHTSAPGAEEHSVPVKALRIEKREPSPENELLRGVHDNTTTYTLRVYHTGEGDVSNVKVVDFLPAGLEYLGVGGTDNSRTGPEYPSAASLVATPVPDGDNRAGRMPRSDPSRSLILRRSPPV